MMKSYLLFSAIALLLGATPAHAQVNLTEMSPASADSLQKCRIRYFSPGSGGRGKVWDFFLPSGWCIKGKILAIRSNKYHNTTVVII